MKESWTNEMKQLLDGHRMTPPAGLWEGIGEQMGFPTAPVRPSAVVRRWYWAAAAAAAVLVLVVFFVTPRKSDPAEVLVQASTPAPPEYHEAPIALVEKPVADMSGTVSARPKSKSEVNPERNSANAPVTREETAPDERMVSQEDTLQASRPVSPQHAVTPQAAIFHEAPAKNHAPRKWSVGLNVSGGLLLAQSSQQTEMTSLWETNSTVSGHYTSMFINELMTGLDGQAASGGPSQMDFVSEHRLPVRLGLSLHYQLSPRVAFLSGVDYTYLYSRFSLPFYKTAISQRLHYLGIPVGLSVQLWSNSSFRLYVSGSTMLAKCLNENPWQWSVDAAAGAEYNLMQQLGVYLEPSLGYYFDDGSSLKHYYKEHPLAPSIEFGLRLHIPTP